MCPLINKQWVNTIKNENKTPNPNTEIYQEKFVIPRVLKI